MLKRESFYIVFVSMVALSMSAGCAKQEIVKKDEVVAPVSIARQIDPPTPVVTTSKQAAADPVVQEASPIVSVQQAQKASSSAQLQSALEKIYFDFDSAGLSESARNTLSGNASRLMKDNSEKVRIEGNCDERGSAEYNLALGESRAKAAQQYLITLGVKPDRISIVSYGKEKPAVQGSDEAAWAKNRRDEFVVVTP